MLSHEVLLWFPNQVTERALAWLEGKRLTAPYECLCLVGGGSEEFRYFRVPPTASSLVCCLGTLPFSPCVRALSRSLWYIWEAGDPQIVSLQPLPGQQRQPRRVQASLSSHRLFSHTPAGVVQPHPVSRPLTFVTSLLFAAPDGHVTCTQSALQSRSESSLWPGKLSLSQGDALAPAAPALLCPFSRSPPPPAVCSPAPQPSLYLKLE